MTKRHQVNTPMHLPFITFTKLHKTGIVKGFSKFTGKYLCQSLHFNKIAGLRTAILLKNRFRHKCFPVNLAKFLRTRFLQTPLDDCLYPLKMR